MKNVVLVLPILILYLSKMHHAKLLWLIFNNKSDFFNYDFLFELSAITTRFCSSRQPSQNVPAASNFAAYNEISAAYFTLKFINNKCKVSSGSNCDQRPSASAAYYSSYLAYYSKTFWLGWVEVHWESWIERARSEIIYLQV